MFINKLRLCRQAMGPLFNQSLLKTLAGLKPSQQLILGFFSYVLLGTLFLCAPGFTKVPVNWLDHAFNATSAMSTTGLTTISVADSYTLAGQWVLLILFQLGGIGYMTVSSFIILARGQALSETRLKILQAEFTLPRGFDLKHFIRQVVVFTVVIEAIGTLLLWWEFSKAGVPDALWSAFFHCVSAFATAGFSLNNNSLESFALNPVVNLTISVLCYLGAIGFIVLQDAWLSFRDPKRNITLTSKIILVVTGLIWLVGTPLFYISEPSLAYLGTFDRWLVASFQIMTASSTAGFNTVPIGSLGVPALLLIGVAMLIGASPSGTGGGIKTTSASALTAITLSVMRGYQRVLFWKHEVPVLRLRTAVASSVVYFVTLTIGVFLLCCTERQDFLKILFEAASALGTVGLSMGITGELTPLGKGLVTLLMFIGRVGPLTLGFSLLHRLQEDRAGQQEDLAT
jgi:trk system potassium uptake protein